MNNTEVFYKVKEHLLKQGKRSQAVDLARNEYGLVCRYRSDDGCKCAIGCLIEDSEYDPKMEGLEVRNLFEKFPHLLEKFKGADLKMLIQLQDLHDKHDPSTWQKELAYLEELYKDLRLIDVDGR